MSAEGDPLRAWLVWLRIARLPGCRALPDESDPRLECVVVAASPDEARARLEAALARDRYGIEEIEACQPFDAASCDDVRDPQGRIRAAVRQARASGGIAWASFARGPLAEARA